MRVGFVHEHKVTASMAPVLILPKLGTAQRESGCEACYIVIREMDEEERLRRPAHWRTTLQVNQESKVALIRALGCKELTVVDWSRGPGRRKSLPLIEVIPVRRDPRSADPIARIISIAGQPTMICSVMSLAVYRGSKLRNLGARVFNTVADHMRLPLAILCKANDDRVGPANVSDETQFYLVTDDNTVLCPTDCGFSALVGSSTGTCYVSTPCSEEMTIFVGHRGQLINPKFSWLPTGPNFLYAME